MLVTRTNLTDLAYFLAIARHRNFRLAGLELGVSASAASHALKGFEERAGVRLINRTNRSVTLTSAGKALEQSVSGSFADIGAALEGLDQLRTTPGGKIRINAVVDAVTLVLGPVLAELSRRHPDIEVDLVSSNRIVDIVGEGFDAGVRYGGTVPEDMIAQRLSADLRWVVAASPRYLDEHGTPTHPDELKHHRCLGVRLGDDSIYRWEFEGPEGDFEVPIKSAMTADDSRSTLAMALNGAGLTFGLEPLFAKHVADGNLRVVLTDWVTTGPGFYLYYSGRRQLPVGLRTLLAIAGELKPLG
ncbi:LysR family transcriptional regulator [Sphingomonas aerolata]|uniref:LysR family transcriptional regulator n=1 Tax=Sphingomonas aerolata TaxID=185951 RepID=UPI002FE231E8